MTMWALLIFVELLWSQVTHVQTEQQSTTGYVTSSGPLVNTPYGSVEGVRLGVGSSEEVEAFLGVPFGRPPTGELRFAKPQPALPWQGILKAHKKGPGCPQADQRLSRHLRLDYMNHSSEDCLMLNIWRPVGTLGSSTTQDALKPVFVFIYGGSFQWGSSDLFLYDGGAFAAANRVIFVSLSYRVGLLGFAHHSEIPELTGTAGLWDQNLALHWIRDNIALFGGDPTEVTVCGHSAGAISAALHAISPHARGLFRRAILQSGSSLSLSTLNRIPRKELEKAAQNLGCGGDSRQQLDCLRTINATELVHVADLLGYEGMALPPVESDYTSLDPAQLEHVEFNVEQLIIGTNQHEASIFARRALDSNENLRKLFSGVGHLVSLVGILRAVFHTPLAESRRIVSAYFPEEREYPEEEIVDLIADAATDLFFTCPAHFYSQAALAAGVGVYRYFFQHQPSYSLYEDIPGALHGEELPYTLGNLRVLKKLIMEDNVTKSDATVQNLNYTTFEENLMDEILHIWGTFTRQGIPILGDGKAWPRFTESHAVFIDISDNGVSVRRGSPNVQRCFIWENVIMQRAPLIRTEGQANDYASDEETVKDSENDLAASASARRRASVKACSILMLSIITMLRFKKT
ncbi:acetylcholinesterase-like isoform X2 [Varroa jacobsoni]|uniref:acetylcholinesterase-like isoform X2 n=1 Tax=Varroa jacobsoni TaxID=62625 RepID=UPI000BF5423A|nr:acetylcholinesterase-like isoform X2 [Varroa jacobsoni]